jgi:hypothetical protein
MRKKKQKILQFDEKKQLDIYNAQTNKKKVTIDGKQTVRYAQ